MKTINRLEALEQIYNTNGRLFSVIFKKKNGEDRKMLCRLGVHKHVKGKGLKFKPTTNLINVYDMQKKGYRFINLYTLKAIQINGETKVVL